MSWSAVGSFLQAGFAGAGTIALNNQNVGDLILLAAYSVDSSTNHVNSISGGGATWSQIGTTFVGSVNAKTATIWAGKVTATGAQTATLNITGGGPTIRVAGQEFSSTLGSWTLDGQANLDGSGTNTWPSLTPASSGELYFGFASNSNSASKGSTSGYVYQVTSQGNGCAFDPSCGTSATSPVWADSTQVFGSMILVKEVSGGGGSGGPGTFTYVGPKQTPVESNPFSLTTYTIGDIVLLEVALSGTGITVSGVSGGNCTWTQIVAPVNISALAGYASIWLGTVTSTGAANVTLTFSGGTPSTIRPIVDEFSVSTGAASVQLDNYVVLDNAAGTNTVPTATPSGSGELLWGYAHDMNSSTAGSTPGVLYEIDGNGNGTNYDLSVSAPTTVVWGDSSHNGGITALLTASTSGSSGNSALVAWFTA